MSFVCELPIDYNKLTLRHITEKHNMKKIAIFLYIIITFQTLIAQKNSLDSTKVSLVKQTSPIERFNTIIKFLEDIDAKGNRIDSTTCNNLLQIAKQLNNDSLRAISYNWKGFYLFQNKGDNSNALDCYFKALPMAEKYNDKRRISSLYFDIASVYHSLQDADKFLHFTKKGEENLPTKTSPMYNYMLVQYQRNMGTFHLEKRDFEKALSYANKTLATSKKLNSKGVFKFRALHFLGYVHEKLDKIERADSFYKEALNLSYSMNNEIKKMTFYQRYFSFLIENKKEDEERMDEAKALTETMWSMYDKSRNLNFKLLAAGSKKKMFDINKQIDSAYYYSKKESDIKDSIFNQNNRNAIQALSLKEELRKEEEDEKKIEEAHRREQNIQYSLIFLGIVSFIILFFLLSRSIIVTGKWISFFGTLGLLIVFEFINMLIHPFVERVTHHSPLLMLLSLVPLAALLIPLHHHMESWINVKMIAKNKKIRLENAKKTIVELEER